MCNVRYLLMMEEKWRKLRFPSDFIIFWFNNITYHKLLHFFKKYIHIGCIFERSDNNELMAVVITLTMFIMRHSIKKPTIELLIFGIIMTSMKLSSNKRVGQCNNVSVFLTPPFPENYNNSNARLWFIYIYNISSEKAFNLTNKTWNTHMTMNVL